MSQPQRLIQEAFGPELLPGALYIGPTLQQRIDLIEHLLEFGRQLILLCGPQGSGKTTLLDAMGDAAASRWHCVKLNGGPALGAQSMLHQIAARLGLQRGDEAALADELLPELRQRMAGLERSGKLVVLLIDDADRLPPDTIAMITQLARAEDPQSEARVLMTAQTHHEALIASLQRDHAQHGLVHVVEIPPLAEDQVEAFLAQRMSAAGGELEGLLSGEELAAISAEGGGNPEQTLVLARQLTSGRTPQAASSGQAWRARLTQLPWRRYAPFAPLPFVLLGAAWWLFSPAPPAPVVKPDIAVRQTQGSMPASATPPRAEPVTTEALPPPPTPATGGGERQRMEITLPPAGSPDTAPTVTMGPVPSSPKPGTTESLTPLPPTEPAKTAAMSSPLAAVPLPPAEKPGAHPAVPPPPQLAAPKPAGRRVVAEATPAPPAPTQKKSAPPPAAAPARPSPPVKTADKTAHVVASRTAHAAPARPAAPAPHAAGTDTIGGSGWTLQLFGVTERTAATSFIARHKLGAEAWIIDSQRNGKPWHVVILGRYPSKTSAQAAAAHLPPGLKREVQPWVRNVREYGAAAP